MALPINIGDLIAICKLAYQVHDRCKSSVTEFRELSREVDNLQIVLDEVKSFWERQKASGHELVLEKQRGLAKFSQGCQETLSDLNALLDKHRELGNGKSFLQRMRWAPKDIGPMRSRLLNQTVALATFNATLTATVEADAQAKAHAEILKAVTTIHNDYQQGRRKRSAVSQAAATDVATNPDETWKDIASEIEGESVARSVIDENAGFIRRWRQRVILEDVGESEEYDQEGLHDITAHHVDQGKLDDRSSLYSPSRVISWVSSQTLNQPARRQGSRDTDSVLSSPTIFTTDTFEAERNIDARIDADTCSTHSSQRSDWRPKDGPNSKWVEALFVKVLRAGETMSYNEEHVTLIAKRMFHQLDYTDRGFLSYDKTSETCQSALRAARIEVKEASVMQLIVKENKSRNWKISRREFIRIVGEVLLLSRKNAEKSLAKQIETDQDTALVKMHRFVASNLASLPWRWESEKWEGQLDKWVLNSSDQRLFRSSVRPCAPIDSLVNMHRMAIGLCMDPLQETFENWSKVLDGSSKEVWTEYDRPISKVIDVASQFSLLSNAHMRALDDFDELANATMHIWQDVDRESCRVAELRAFKRRCLALLESMLGFVYALDSHPGARHEHEPFSLTEWRRMRISDRADRISSAAAVFRHADPLLDRSLSWIGMHTNMAQIAHDGMLLTYEVHRQQMSEAGDKIIKETKVKNQVDIKIIRAMSIRGFMDRSTSRVSLRNIDERSPMMRSDKVQGSNPAYNLDEHGVSVELDTKLKVEVELDTLTHKVRLHHEFRISEFIPNLSVPGTCTKTLILHNTSGKPTKSSIEISITPRPISALLPTVPIFTSHKQLTKAILKHPLPPGWIKQDLPDGQIYFQHDGRKRPNNNTTTSDGNSNNSNRLGDGAVAGMVVGAVLLSALSYFYPSTTSADAAQQVAANAVSGAGATVTKNTTLTCACLVD